jgi:Domain of unknown function (DUF5666)
MAKPVKSLPYLLALAVSAVSVACGGGSTATVTGSNDTQGAPASSSPVARTASIQGTLRSSTGAADVGAASMGGIKVSVVGTSIQVTTEGSGQFTLTGISPGSAELRFQGKGLDARLTIAGLVAGQTLTLTFQVNGSSVTKVGDDDGQHGNEVELKGTIDSVSPSTNSLMVAGRKVTVTSSTRIVGRDGQTIALTGLAAGQKVEVDGATQSDGSVQASKIKLEDNEGDDDQGENQVDFDGTISALSPLTIAGRHVTTNSSTRYFGDHNASVPASDVLKLGNKVEVEGQQQADKSVLASKIQLED